MKQQIIFSPDAEHGSDSSEPVKRLAQRYNIPEKDVEALLYGSRTPKSEAWGSDTKGKPMPEEFRPVYQIPPPQQPSGWSAVNVLSAIVGVLGILALTIILIAVLKRHDFSHHPADMPPPPPMTAPERLHAEIQDSSKKDETSINNKQDDIPAPATKNEMENKSASKPHYRIIRQSSPGFATTNSLEAQEHLAELRADGNSRARIRQSKRNGLTVYNVK